MSKAEDLTGQKFGRWTVLARADDYLDSKGKHYSQWLCRCECGNQKVLRGSYLRSGKSKSCGCLYLELYGEPNQLNEYDLTGEYGVGFLKNGQHFYFDLDDYPLIKDKYWRLFGQYVATRKRKHGKDEITYLHHLVVGRKYVDHANRNTLDNRKENLRPYAGAENNYNRSKQRNNTSGVIGVTYNKSNDYWVAQICIDKNVRIWDGIGIKKTQFGRDYKRSKSILVNLLRKLIYVNSMVY